MRVVGSPVPREDTQGLVAKDIGRVTLGCC